MSPVSQSPQTRVFWHCWSSWDERRWILQLGQNGLCCAPRARQREVTPAFQAQTAAYATKDHAPTSLGLANLPLSAQGRQGEGAAVRSDHVE